MAKPNKNATSQSGTAHNGNGPANPNNNQKSPLLQFDFVERQESTTYKLDERVLEMIDRYPDYIESVQGRRPTPDQVVEKGLFKVFMEDIGFQKFLQTAVGKSGSPGYARTVKETTQIDLNNPANAAQVG